MKLDRDTVTTLAFGIGIGVAIGWVLRSRVRRVLRVPNGRTGGTEEIDLTDDDLTDSGEIKMVIVARMDLKMGKGKIAAQCCHASVGCLDKLSHTNPMLLQQWRMCGQPKVVVKTDNEESLIELSKRAMSLGLTTSLIRDAGRTQIAAGSRTVLGVGPAVRHFYRLACYYIKKKFPIECELIRHAEILYVSQEMEVRIDSIDYFVKSFPHLSPQAENDQLYTEFFKFQMDSSVTFLLTGVERVDQQWVKVGDSLASNGSQKYASLSEFILQHLCIPHSNSDSERIFSLVRKNKTDFRASLGAENLQQF